MSWIRNGTIAVTNNSSTVTGTGTNWVGRVELGDAITLPDGKGYEITAVLSGTSLTVATPYMGSTLAGQPYQITPGLGWAQRVVQQVGAWMAGQQGYLDGPLAGRFGDGTAAAPGLAFLSDLDTGLHRPAANEIGFATGGVVRMRLTAAGLLTGTAVQTNPTDTTAGRLMPVGAFGLGNRINYNGNLDDITVPGFYGLSNTVTSGPSGLSASNIDGSDLQHFVYNTNNHCQVLYVRGAAGGRAIWTRRKISGTWSAWRMVYDQTTVLGTVSQSGGVPTGALIESGSNANGEYARFADGTQICRYANSSYDLSAAVAPGSISAAHALAFPAAFVGAVAKSICGQPSNVGGSRILGSSLHMDSTAINWTFTCHNLAAAALTPTQVLGLQLLAVGRWF